MIIFMMAKVETAKNSHLQMWKSIFHQTGNSSTFLIPSDNVYFSNGYGFWSSRSWFPAILRLISCKLDSTKLFSHCKCLQCNLLSTHVPFSVKSTDKNWAYLMFLAYYSCFNSWMKKHRRVLLSGDPPLA